MSAGSAGVMTEDYFVVQAAGTAARESLRSVEILCGKKLSSSGRRQASRSESGRLSRRSNRDVTLWEGWGTSSRFSRAKLNIFMKFF